MFGIAKKKEKMNMEIKVEMRISINSRYIVSKGSMSKGRCGHLPCNYIAFVLKQMSH
jgi:hypothetical protein